MVRAAGAGAFGGTLARFALIRRWRANCLQFSFHHPGEGFLGGAVLYVVPLNKGDPACWRPAWGGVRCAAMVGGSA